jgi:ribosomal protein S16
MVVKIRLARFGRRKAPFYNIVVSQARFVLAFPGGLLFQTSTADQLSRTARNSKPIEVLGMPRPISPFYYQPMNQTDWRPDEGELGLEAENIGS